MNNNLGNKEIMAKNIQYYMDLYGKSRNDMCEALGVKYTTFTDWVKANSYPRIDKIEMMANYFGIEKADLVEDRNSFNIKPNRIPVLGSVPAGVPINAIEDIVDWEDIPLDWLNGGREYFGLKVKGDSMYPKYMEGDTIIVRKENDCESGQDCVVYVNGCDATLKKVVKKQDCIILQPLNPVYDPKIYDYNDEENPITIAGVVVEIRRAV
ncbi:MAG: LexA family protein [Anaerovoracaceae bacterium]